MDCLFGICWRVKKNVTRQTWRALFHFGEYLFQSIRHFGECLKKIVSHTEVPIYFCRVDNKLVEFVFQFCYENDKAQKYLLGGLEQLVGNVHKDELLPKMPHILKTLYDLDILDEKVIIDWGEKVSICLFFFL